jgi:hypothetical protein
MRKKIKKILNILLLIFVASIAFADENKSLYVGNYFSQKFHYAHCKWVREMNPKNKVSNKTREWLIKNGYVPCKVCKP